MRAVVAARTASREDTRAHVAPAVSPRINGNRLLVAGLRWSVLLARLSLIPRHRQAWLLWCRESVEWRVELRSVVFNDEGWFCLYASIARTHVRHRPNECHLLECIRLRHTGPTSGSMVWGASSYNSRSHLAFLQGEINSARYIVQVVNPVLLPFLRQEGYELFSRTTHVHVRLLPLNVLFVVYTNCSGQQELQIFRQLNTYRTWWSGNLLFLQRLPQQLPNCDNGCKMLGTFYRRMTFVTFMTFCMQEYTSALLPEGVHCVFMWLFGHPLLWHASFIWSEFVILYYLSHQFSIQWNFSLRVLHISS